MTTLRQLLDAECSYRMKDETMDRFIELMTERIELKENEALIPYGKLDDNVYVIISGIVRYIYFDGSKEVTYGFSLPGTVIISYHPFYRREPSYFQMEACCESTVVKIPKRKFVELSEQSTDFAQWIMWLCIAQLWIYERKLSIVNGNAKERIESLVRNRPEIMEKVSAKIIASYIGISPEHLSRLKKQLFPRLKK